MKVLIVCSGNSGQIGPFVKEQGESLREQGILIDYFLIKGHGILGYLKNLPRLRKQIRNIKYDLIHAHYGLSGMLCVLQRKIPVIITFHGSDINNSYNRKFSKVAMKLSTYNIFVHKSIKEKVNAKNNYSITPCGVNLQTFYPMDKDRCRKEFKLDKKNKIILFSSAFDNSIKNYPLAKKSIELLNDDNCKLLELKGFTRNEINLLMNAADLLLVTSFSETGPLVVKEAMACNLPIVSTDVGDVKEVIGNTEGCYICSYDPKDVAEKIKKALDYAEMYNRTDGRNRIIELGLDSDIVAKKIMKVYEEVLKIGKGV